MDHIPAKTVRIYRNGDSNYAGKKFVIADRKIRSYDALLQQVTDGIKASFGAVRNIYTPFHGHRVHCIEELEDGHFYVAAGPERYRKYKYEDIQDVETKRRQSRRKQIDYSKLHIRKISPTRTRLTDLVRNKSIRVYPNGDVAHPGHRVLITKRMMFTWDTFLGHITDRVSLNTGATRKVFTTDGKQIFDCVGLLDGAEYVAVGSERFKRLPYQQGGLSPTMQRHASPTKDKGHSAVPPHPVHRISPPKKVYQSLERPVTLELSHDYQSAPGKRKFNKPLSKKERSAKPPVSSFETPSTSTRPQKKIEEPASSTMNTVPILPPIQSNSSTELPVPAPPSDDDIISDDDQQVPTLTQVEKQSEIIKESTPEPDIDDINQAPIVHDTEDTTTDCPIDMSQTRTIEDTDDHDSDVDEDFREDEEEVQHRASQIAKEAVADAVSAAAEHESQHIDDVLETDSRASSRSKSRPGSEVKEDNIEVEENQNIDEETKDLRETSNVEYEETPDKDACDDEIIDAVELEDENIAQDYTGDGEESSVLLDDDDVLGDASMLPGDTDDDDGDDNNSDVVDL